MSKTKSMVTIWLVVTMLVSMTACSGGKTTENSTTPTTTTTVPEVTTEEPTTEYVYKGIRFTCGNECGAEYFNGLILEKGDKIYLNDVVTGQTLDDEANRGSIAFAILGNFKMKEERQAFKEKYWSDSTWPFVPYSDNYCIVYTGEKVEFILAEKDDDGVIYDVIPVE